MQSTLPYPYSRESSAPSRSNSTFTGTISSANDSHGDKSPNDGSASTSRCERDAANPTKKRRCPQRANGSSSSSPGSGSGSYRSVFGSSGSEGLSLPEDYLSAAENLTEGSLTPTAARTVAERSLGLPGGSFIRILSFLDHRSLLNARLTCKSWSVACAEHKQLKFPSVYQLPVELVQEILGATSPLSFNASRHVCRAWYLSALEPFLLRQQLEALGFYNAESSVKRSRNVHYLTTRLSRECSLNPGNRGGCGLRNTAILDLSELVAATTVHFTVSICGSYALLSEGCVVYVYRLLPAAGRWMEFVASVICPRRVLAVSMDTSSRRFAIAILLVYMPPLQYLQSGIADILGGPKGWTHGNRP